MRSLLLAFTGLCLAASVVMAHGPHTGHDHDHDHDTPVQAHFVENQGQWDAPFRYRADVRGATVFVEKGGLTWVKLDPEVFEVMHNELNMTQDELDAFMIRGHAWKVRFIGAMEGPLMSGSERAAHYHNYFLGNDPARWKGRVPLYGGVDYEELWPGIGMQLRLKEGDLKYDLLLAPGADPALIALAYEGMEGIRVSGAGELVLPTSVGEVLEMKPVVFYADGAREPIPCRYRLDGTVLGYDFPEGYDATRAVVIDPTLIASTLSGATGSWNWGHCATYDDAGNMYTGARCFGPTYPVTPGAFQNSYGGGNTDVTISKYNPDGSQLIYATYLGGNSGEVPHSMVVSTNFELALFSSTTSTNYPTTPGAFSNTLSNRDFAITRFSADGSSLVGSTFVGGSGEDAYNSMFGNYTEEYRGEIFLDQQGNIVVAGFTQSSDFPTSAGCFQPDLGGGQDGVVFSLNPSCTSLLYSTYLGGSSNDAAMGVRLADNGDILVTGGTESSDFPTTAGAYQPNYQGGSRDGFVVRLSPDASTMVAGTYFGTASEDRSYFVDTGVDGSVWILGQSLGDIPIQPSGTYGQPGGTLFIAKFAEDLSEAPTTTTIGPGGFFNTAPVAFLVDVCDNVYISGFNSATGFPLTSDSFYSSGSFYLAVYSPQVEEMLFGTYYGGSHVDGGTSRFDKNGVVYQGVCSGMGSLQTTPWAWATNQTIGWDIGVFKIDMEQSGVIASVSASDLTACTPATIDFTATGNAVAYSWELLDLNVTGEGETFTYTFEEPGQYTMMLIGFDPTTCNLSDTAYAVVTIVPLIEPEVSFEMVQEDPCAPYTVQFINTSRPDTGFDYTWEMSDGTIFGTMNATHTFPGPGSYTVLLTMSEDACNATGSFEMPIDLEPPPPVLPLFVLWQGGACESLTVGSLNESSGGPSGGLAYTWDMGDGTIFNDPDVTHIYTEPGVYVVTLTATDTLCGDQGTYTLEVELEPVVVLEEVLTVPNVFTPNGDGLNDTFFPLPETGGRVSLKVYNRWGRIVHETGSGFRPWNGSVRPGDKAPDGVYFYLLEYDIPCAGVTYSGRKEGAVQLLR